MTTVYVAATGPSLTQGVADILRGQRVIAVNDAYRLLPFAEVLYACDARWWDVHKGGGGGFAGQKWSTHEKGVSNDKTACARKWGLRLAPGAAGDVLRTDGTIAYGGNSGFQAVGLAIILGFTRIVLVGFDMRAVDGRRHFFGNHPRPLRNSDCYKRWVKGFDIASKALPSRVTIFNATPNSAIKSFQMVRLEDEIRS